ncbi:hypothetical protein I3843_08G137600 [Carya illinoinensis]|nr:hypothetical protein I3843_08G137600 [Carya illinoinensis]
MVLLGVACLCLHIGFQLLASPSLESSNIGKHLQRTKNEGEKGVGKWNSENGHPRMREELKQWSLKQISSCAQRVVRGFEGRRKWRQLSRRGEGC